MPMPAAEDSRAARIAALDFDYAAQPKRLRGRCNLCGGERFVAISHSDRYGYPARADGCLRCGLCFLNPVMTQEAYARFYRDVYRPLVSAYHGRRIDAETIQAEQRNYAAVLCELLGPRLEKHAGRRLLDVGGSTGVVANALKEGFDLSATVLDPAPLETRVAERLGLRAVTGFVEDFEAGAERWDVITLCQTADHLLDLALTLHKIRGLLAEDGVFFADIVDFRAAYRRVGAVEGAVKIDHPFYISEDTMAAYLARSGFEILAIDYAADHLHVGFVCAPGPAKAEALPAPAAVTEQWREIRAVQNPLP